jgi:DNA sulfur modification protein DndD
MLIESITVENFLPFQGKQTVEFSTDSNRNVTLIMGNNGSGKTSLAQAFEWCLYGLAPKESTSVINAFVRDHISSGSYMYASVEIVLVKDSVTYTITRRQKYSRRESGLLDKPGQQEFGISYKEGGQTRQVATTDLSPTINRLLAHQLSHYFFFDGEHVKNMRTELERGKSSDFANAVKSIIGLQPIASALQHLKAPGNRLSVERWFNRQIDLAGDQDLQAKSKRIDTLEKKIERLSLDLEDAELDEKTAIENVAKWDQLLRENQASEEAQKDLERTRRNKEAARIAFSQTRTEFFSVFRRELYRFLIERPVRDAQQELANEDKISKGVPSVDNKTIEFILERGECICGTKFKQGDEIAQHLYELLSYVPPKDLGTYISEFDKDCRVRTESPMVLRDGLANAYRKFQTAAQAIRTADEAFEKAKARLESLNNIDVGILRRNRNQSDQDRSRAAGRAATARRDIAAAKDEITQLKADIQSYSVKNAKNQEIKLCLQYVDYIYDFLSSFYSKKEASTRNELGNRVNKFFSRMYDGEIRLELDDNYGVTVVVDNVDTSSDPWKTSSGQTLAIILAFILGILDIAEETRESAEGLMKGDTYPLVMDAPLSDFDKTRIGTICNLLPEVAEQVVIIIKDTDGDLAEEHMRDRIGRRYTIERVRDYESRIRE